MRVQIDDSGAGISLAGEYHRIYTGAFVPASLAPVTHLQFHPEPSASVTYSLQAPLLGYLARRTPGATERVWRLPPPGAATAVALGEVFTRAEAHLEIRADDRTLARLPTLLLDAWQWPHDRSARAVAATYVLPGDRVTARLVSDAQLFETPLPAGGETVPVGAETVSRIALALYRHLAESREIRYERPRIDIEERSRATHQRVRSPEDILPSPGNQRGQGNCLDLTLLFAGCFESLGLDPVLCFVGNPDEAPVHVFPGVWTSRSRRFRPLLTDRTEMARWVNAGELFVLEATGVCPGPMRLGAEAARDAARGRLLSGEPLHLVDVAAARPPAGSVRPLEIPNDPVVQCALWRAEAQAREVGSPHLETLHLLHGLCGPEEGLTRLVLTRAGSSPERVRGLLESARGDLGAPRPPAPTQNFELCWSAARGYARAAGRSRVEEIDLLWAVIENPSRNVKRVLGAVGADLAGVIRELEDRGGRPGLASISLDMPKQDA